MQITSSVKICYLNKAVWISSRTSRSLLFFFVFVQSHQNEVEIFDENLAHISTWLYQTQIHLDEAERLAPTERDNMLKVRKECITVNPLGPSSKTYYFGCEV